MTNPLEFQGRWVQRGMIRVPVIEAEPVTLECGVCGDVSVTELCGRCRSHLRQISTHENQGTHAGYNRHVKNGTPVCDLCREGERLYQHARWLRRRAEKRSRKGVAPTPGSASVANTT